MAKVRLTSRAFAALKDIFEYVAKTDPERALDTVQRIREAIMILEHHSLIGRAVEDDRRELVISRGCLAFLALYRWRPADDTVLILAIHDARQAGYFEE